MAGLPPLEWISLREALDLALEFSGADEEKVQRLLLQDFGERLIRTRGWSDRYFRHPGQGDLASIDWGHATVNWGDSTVRFPSTRYQSQPYLITEVEVHRNNLVDRLATSDPNSAAHQKNKGGRPEEYDWVGFYHEVIRIADMDGVPDSQAELVKRLLDWFRTKHDKYPGDSTVKVRVSKLYQALGRGPKPRV